MSIYQQIAKVGLKIFQKKTLFKYGFNLSPMYKRSTAKIIEVSDDLLDVTIQLPLSFKNKNYVNSIFGGSMFSAVDPIPMVQLINLIGDDFVVWDKSAEIFFKRPAKENLYAHFNYSENELEEIKQQVAQQKEIEIIKTTQLTNKEKTLVYCEVKKKIYIADKDFYKQKRKKNNRK
ncbi:MAG: DUF4442 domain-containing protein [Aureispira sp.]